MRKMKDYYMIIKMTMKKMMTKKVLIHYICLYHFKVNIFIIIQSYFSVGNGTEAVKNSFIHVSAWFFVQKQHINSSRDHKMPLFLCRYKAKRKKSPLISRFFC